MKLSNSNQSLKSKLLLIIFLIAVTQAQLESDFNLKNQINKINRIRLATLPKSGNIANCQKYLSYGICATCEPNYYISDSAHSVCSQCQAISSSSSFLNQNHSQRNTESTCSVCNNAPSNAEKEICSICPIGCSKCNTGS